MAEAKDVNVNVDRVEEPTENVEPVASSGVALENNQLVVDYTNDFTNYNTFSTRKDLESWVHDVAKRFGMMLKIKTSNPGKNRRRRPYVVLVCERAGQYQGPKIPGEEVVEKGKRKTGSKKCNCPFEVKGTKLGMEDGDVEWELRVVCGVHNHPDFENFEGHSYAGRLTCEEMSLVESMSNALVKPKTILTSLKQRNANNASIMKTIYNARQKLMVKEKACKSQMQLLFAKLTEKQYIVYHRPIEGTDEVTDLLWTHPTCKKLACSYPYVLVMDCTHKTNRYGLPFLEIVGVTSTGNTYLVAFAYLQHEKVYNYEWALRSLRNAMEGCPAPNCIVTDRDLALMKAIEIVYPCSRQFLCRWHVSKNILAKCKKMLKNTEKWKCFEADWANLVEQPTEELFYREWDNMKRRFVDYPEAVSYIATSWLDPYKEKIVSARTNKCKHLGTFTFNRVEGAHWRMKKDLGNALGTFVDNWKHIDNLLMLQHNAIKAEFEKSKNTYQHCYKLTIYNELRGRVSLYALGQIKLQVDHAKAMDANEDMNCMCDIRSTHGLPCAHEIHSHVANRTPIPLEWIDPYWKHLSMEPIVGSEGRPRITYARELQEFHELFEKSDDMKKEQLRIQLRQIVHPHTTSLTEPMEKIATKGRPTKKMKLERSTRRNPSEFEYHLDSSKDSCSAKVTSQKSCANTRSVNEKFIPTSMPKPITVSMVHDSFIKSSTTNAAKPKLPVRRRSGKDMFIGQTYAKFRRWVHDIINVGSDGHCGFRAIASMVGLGEDNWAQVQSDLLDELIANDSIYMDMHRRRENIDEMEELLRCWETSAPIRNWISLPNMGHLIASKYDIVLVFLSPQQCLTFLPVSSAPKFAEMRQEHGLAFVNGNHSVHVVLKHNCPLPPVANYWERYHHPTANGWKTDEMETRIPSFKKLVGTNVALQEYVHEISSDDVHV